MPKLLYFISEDWFFCSHFLDRAQAAQRAGYEVVVLTRVGDHGHRLREAGFRLIELRMDRAGTHPLRELGVLRQVWRAYRAERPDLLHHVALKPIVYGSLVARCLRLRAVVNAPVGMGYVFTAGGGRGRLLRVLVRSALRMLLNPPGSAVVFENDEDLSMLVKEGAVRGPAAHLIPGAGIDLAVFHPAAVVRVTTSPIVLLGARMLKDKGVREFVEAARMLRAAGVVARFWLVGEPDPDNPSSLKREQLAAWHGEGVVEWLGRRTDMPDLLRQAQIACLPSYREGLPKFLLEAMATGLPVVATDVPGCRSAVVHGRTGLLVPSHDAERLAQALAQLIGDTDACARMGQEGLRWARREFVLERITQRTLVMYAEMCS